MYFIYRDILDICIYVYIYRLYICIYIETQPKCTKQWK